MAERTWLRIVARSIIVTGLAVGCNKEKPAVSGDIGVEPKPPTVAIGSGAGTGGVAKEPSEPANRMQQSFTEACTVEINADSGVALPPTYTFTKKNTGQVNEEVQRLWNQIRFTGSDGKPQTYLLQLELTQSESALGTIEIMVRPDLAPNHARNFVALAMTGYYDGLRIDRVVKQQGENASQLILLEAGSPVEDADPAMSHLGYWLRPEFNAEVKHEEGSVGACLLASEDNAETASCRFYINLTPAPAMDGNFTVFAKVTRGLDLAKKISEFPIRGREGEPDVGRPVTPIVIKKATVQAVPIVQ